MHEIALFGEDFAHQQVVNALVRRLATDMGIECRLNWRNARGGHGKVVEEFNAFMADLRREGGSPDLIIVVTDANCKGLSERRREFEGIDSPAQIIMAIPEPHIERWLLLDGAAFRDVVGLGCDAPNQKCERERYKQLLINAIYDAGITPSIGGIEFAEDIVQHMNIDRTMNADRSFRRFVEEIRQVFRQWQQ